MSLYPTRSRMPASIGVLALIALAALLAFSWGQAAAQSKEADAAPAAETDMVFLSGESLTVSAATTDDMFAAGERVNASGARADHLFLAGGEIDVTDATVVDLVAAGGEVRLQGASIKDDIIIAGGDIAIGSAVKIGGSAVLAGGTVKLEAPLGGDLRAGAGDVYVNSPIAGTARLSGDSIVLGPKTRIAGDLLYRSDKLTVQPGAVVEGRRASLPMSDRSVVEGVGKDVGRFFLYLGLSIILSYFVLVVLFVVFAPGLMDSASAKIRHRPWQSLGIGVLYALIVPVAIVLLFASVFAVPLAILLVVISVVLTAIALAVTAHFVGISVRRLTTSQEEPSTRLPGRILWPLLGAVLVFAVTLVPFAGVLVWLLAMLFGLGAFATAARALTAPPPG